MTDVITSAPAAAWYPDPAEPELLRWWDGSSWSVHTMQRPELAAGGDDPRLEPAPAAPEFDALPPVLHAVPAKQIPEPMPFASGVSLGADSAEMYADPPVLSPIERAARAEIYAKLASSHAAETAPESGHAGHGQFSTSLMGTATVDWKQLEPLDTFPLRSSTGGAWLLALSPLLAFAAFALVAFQLSRPPVQLVALIVVYAIAVVSPFVFAGVDRMALRKLGHTERPAWWWMLLLPPLVYLIVRTVKLARRSKAAFVPLVAYLVVSVATSVGIAAISPAAIVSIMENAELAVLDQIEIEVANDLQERTGVSFDVTCPDQLDPPIICNAVGDDGTAAEFEVRFDSQGVPSYAPIEG